MFSFGLCYGIIGILLLFITEWVTEWAPHIHLAIYQLVDTCLTLYFVYYENAMLNMVCEFLWGHTF